MVWHAEFNFTTQFPSQDVDFTVIVTRMSHWKWRETKQQPSRARSGHQISCCLVSLHFLCDILATSTVDMSHGRKSVASSHRG